MGKEEEPFKQIGLTLAKHFDSVYYVDIESGRYEEFVHMKQLEDLRIPNRGEDFFEDSVENAASCVHPDDLELISQLNDKEEILKSFSEQNSFSSVYRLIVNGKTMHMRSIKIMCEDKKHMLCCLESIEEEIRVKKERDRDLQSARREARHDDLTGVKNKNAFREFAASIESRIASAGRAFPFGVVMCDVNDLKLINDTRGHSFGDEVIQRTSRMICGVFEHSPVFRVGGDEFIAVLTGRDYDNREMLHKKLIEESIANKKSRSGPVVACGLAVYEADRDSGFDDVYKRADRQMYINKNELKSMGASSVANLAELKKVRTPIPDNRKRLLDGMFGALLTVAGGGYIYLNDMKHDFSRWSLSLVDDFGIESEYMYDADSVWRKHIHPDDMESYVESIDSVLGGDPQMRPFLYRARRADGTYVLLTTRGFVLSDPDGEPEYFGGIIVPE